MSSRRRFASASTAPDYLAPSEGWLVIQAGALVALSAWALGGMREWAQPWLLAVSLLGLVLVAARWRERGEVAQRPFLPALLWVVFVAVAALNPSHESLANGGWIERGDWVRWLPSTVDVAHTVADARIWLVALLEGALLVSLLQSARAARALWSMVALNGFALAAVGAFCHFAGADQVLGFIEPPERSYFFATFFYKNHWAAYGALGAIAAFAVALRATPAAMAGDVAARGQMLLFTCAGLLIAITLPLPGSRAGALLALAIVAGFLATWWWEAANAAGVTRARRRWLLVISSSVALLIITYGWKAYAPRATVDLQRTRAQLARGMDGEQLDVRMPVSRDTLRMARERPWFGWGPGCFEIVFPVFQGNYLRRPDGRPSARFEFAHDDWLQLLAEDGLVGAALLLVPAFLAGRRAWRRARLAGRWAVAGCALVALYAWIDFPFHNPAVLVLWTTLLTSAHRLAPLARAGEA